MAKEKKMKSKNINKKMKSNNIMKTTENMLSKSGMPLNELKPQMKGIKSMIYFALGVVIINIAYISGIIHYLSKLKECQCYQIKNKINYSNITYLIVIEAFLLIINILSFISLIGSILVLNKVKSGGAKNKLNPAFYMGYLIYLLIYGYFVYYVYKLFENVDEDCGCTQNWLRYLLYIQATLMFVGIISLTFNLIMHHF